MSKRPQDTVVARFKALQTIIKTRFDDSMDLSSNDECCKKRELGEK